MITCPFCQHVSTVFKAHGVVAPLFQTFGIVGGGYRLNAECPRCGSLDRERLVLLYLQRETMVFRKSLRILHVAPEQQLSALLRASTVNYISIDLAAQSAMLQADICNTPFRNNSFDLLVCNHVLEHVKDDAKAISELFRITAPDGKAILQVPLARSLATTLERGPLRSDEEREATYGQFDHVRLYGMDYTQRLAQNGYSVSSYDPDKDAELGLREKYGLIVSENVFVGSKLRVNKHGQPAQQ